MHIQGPPKKYIHFNRLYLLKCVYIFLADPVFLRQTMSPRECIVAAILSLLFMVLISPVIIIVIIIIIIIIVIMVTNCATFS
jgi:hypothetical protein